MVNVDQSLTGSNNYISSTINQLINYLKILSTYDKIKSNQSKKLCYFINNLQNLNTKCQNNSGKCLQQLDITVITEIGNFLSIEIFDGYFYSSTIPNKLTQLWNILQQVSEINMLEVITGHNNKDYVKDQKIFEKVFDAANNTEQFIQGVKKRNYDRDKKYMILDISTILLTTIIRSDAHEFQIGEILKRAVKETQSNVDIAYILSIEDKVKKKNKYKPDTRAIRDATAHAHFKIEKDSTDEDYLIKFNNQEEGWNFNKTFTRVNLLFFYQDLDRLYRLYMWLCSLKLLYSFLKTNLLYLNP